MTDKEFGVVNQILDKYKEHQTVADECRKALERLSQFQSSGMILSFVDRPSSLTVAIPQYMRVRAWKALYDLFQSWIDQSRDAQQALQLPSFEPRPVCPTDTNGDGDCPLCTDVPSNCPLKGPHADQQTTERDEAARAPRTGAH